MSNERFDRGRQIRGEVVGIERSEAAIADPDGFDFAFQDLALRYCWGEVWDRPGLDRRTRSIVNLAMLSAMGRSGELAGHIRGALNNGVTKDEIKEIFLQVCIYAGVPLAGEAFKVAKEILGSETTSGEKK